MAASAPTLTVRQLNRATLARQMLLARENTGVVDAVRRLVGLQAQVARPTFVGLWSRISGFRREELLAALRGREIVRATAMRATLHLMAAEDYVGLRGALQPALTRSMQSVLRDRSKGLALPALEKEARTFLGRTPAAFDALRVHLKKKHPKADERAMAYLIRTRVPLVQVPTDAAWGFPASSDFAMADTWLGRKIPTDPAPSHELIVRYLAAFGPATPADVQVWSGLPSVREVFEELRPKLVTFRDARKRELFDLPDAPRPPEGTPAPVRFLPEFDNLVLSHDDRTRVVADEHRPRVVLKNLQVRATFLVDGYVAGTWRTERKKDTAVLVVEPFSTLDRKTVAALEKEADALLRFAEADAARRDVRIAK